MKADISAMLEPLIKRKIFATEEEAIRELVKEYILQQITALQEKLRCFECKYGMHFAQFAEYLHEESVLLEKEGLSPEQRQALGRTIMQHEDDWLDWKMTKEMLESWLGLRQEIMA